MKAYKLHITGTKVNKVVNGEIIRKNEHRAADIKETIIVNELCDKAVSYFMEDFIESFPVLPVAITFSEVNPFIFYTRFENEEGEHIIETPNCNLVTYIVEYKINEDVQKEIEKSLQKS